MINRSYKTTATAVAGTTSATIYATHSEINQIRVIATTATNVFDVKITDRNSIVVFEQKDIYGELAELTNLLVDGTVTLTISNSDADEAFTILIVFKELS